MESNLSSADKRAKFGYELADMLAGAAFPFMLMLILSASVILFSSFGGDGLALQIVILVFGEALLAAAYFIFGRQNGVTAIRRTVQNEKKRSIGTTEKKALYGTGEYALYKAFVIGFLSCIPYIIVQIIGSAAPNTVCDFLLKYAFGWAYYPLSFAGVSTWFNLFWIIPLVGVHAGAYVFGAYKEREKQKKIAEAQDVKGKNKKK